MKKQVGDGTGFTLVEVVIGMFVLSIVALSILGLFTALVRSALVGKRKAVASTLATNQMEYLKSLPYNSLAVSGGSIPAATTIPATTTQTINGIAYRTTTSINYVDDAFDGCGPYPNQATKQLYCRNYPPPSGAPATDLNPADYKIAHVSVYDPSNLKLAEVDTQISARVAETASTTGALFVTVIDDNGSPVSGATVRVTDTTITPNIDVSDSTDSNGNAIFYGLTPDTNGFDYTINATTSGYSSLTTIPQSGTLTPNYPSQKIFTQQSSFVTLTIKPQGSDSLLAETVDTNGDPIGNVKLYIKGGYKKYTANTDTSYYYDNMSGSDSRPTTNNSGLIGVSNLVPGNYIFCGDTGSTSCAIGSTTYYLAAAVPYGGSNSLNPITVPTYLASSPPSTTYPFNSKSYLQKVRLILTTDSGFPRINTLTPDDISTGSTPLSNFAFQVTGSNLPCTSSSSSCGTDIDIIQNGDSYQAACTGNGSTQLSCTVNLTGIASGHTSMRIQANGRTLTLPNTPLGGFNVTP